MKARVQYTGGFLKPLFDHDQDEIRQAKLKIGKIYEVKMTMPRNPIFHAKFFALLNLAYENQEMFTDFESFREFITSKAGYYIKTVTQNGVFIKAKSISFAAMDQVEFEKLYSDVIDAIIREVLPGVEEGELKEEVQQKLAGFF